MTDDDFTPCDQCGASVYKEQLESGIARYEDGRLYCSYCLNEYESAQDTAVTDAADEFAPIELDSDDDGATELDMSSSRIQMVVDSKGGAGKKDESEFKRSLQPQASSATRCRTFHCRISEGAVDFMNNQINEWIDTHDDITVKFSNCVIGMFEGKHTEPNIILTLFY
jgi:hypothetical protein